MQSIAFVPVNVTENHWLLVVIWIKAERREQIEIWDSMGGEEQILKRYLIRDIWKTVNNASSTITKLRTRQKSGTGTVKFDTQTPHSKQTDGSSCGVLVCLFAKALAEGYKETEIINIALQRSSAKTYRNVIAVELWDDYKRRTVQEHESSKEEEEEEDNMVMISGE